MPYKDKNIARTHQTWRSMKYRCNDISNPHYGGKSIKVCPRWLNSFENFLEDMGIKPENMVLDRKENDKDYTPENCQWVTFKKSTANRSVTVYIGNERVKDLSERLKIPEGRIYNRLVLGWTKEDIENHPNAVPPPKSFGTPFQKSFH